MSISNINLSLGQKLCKAREAKELLIEEVAKKLCLSKQRIIDIENDDYSRIKPLVYLRGYLRLYAKLVDVSEEEIQMLELPAYSYEKNTNIFNARITTEECKMVKRRRYLRWFNILFLFLLLMLVIIWWHDSNVSAQDRQSFKNVIRQVVLPTPIR
jgi:cytoskeleton protein RodZ